MAAETLVRRRSIGSSLWLRNSTGSPYLTMASFGGTVPLKVHTVFRFCARESGMEAHRECGVAGLMFELWIEATPGLYTVLVLAAFLRHLDCDLGEELLPALVRPDRAPRAPFDRARVAGHHAGQRGVRCFFRGVVLACFVGAGFRTDGWPAAAIDRSAAWAC